MFLFAVYSTSSFSDISCLFCPWFYDTRKTKIGEVDLVVNFDVMKSALRSGEMREPFFLACVCMICLEPHLMLNNTTSPLSLFTNVAVQRNGRTGKREQLSDYYLSSGCT